MKTDRRWLKEAASQFEENPQYADAHSRHLLKMPTQALLAITEVAADLQQGAKLTRSHVDKMQRVYPAIPRAWIESYAQELNQVGDTNGRVNQFFFRVAGNDASRYREVFDDFQRRSVAEQVNDRGAERDQGAQTRYDQIRAGKTPGERARTDAWIRDQAERRTVIDKLVSANPAHREPNLIDHGNRMDAGAKVLYRASALGDPTVSLRDTIGAAYDSHSAVNAGKEAGVFSESVGVGDIGAEPASASSILDGSAGAP